MKLFISGNKMGDYMKEIVFSPSVHGSLSVAQHIGVGEYPQNWMLDASNHNGGVDNQIEKINKECIEKWNGSHAIGGNADDIIGLEMNLEYGDISEDIPSYKRYQSIYNMISTMYPDERAGDIASSWTNNIQKSNDKFFVKLDAATDNRDEIRIWYSSNPTELSAFYWLMDYFNSKGRYDLINAVYLPPDYWNGERFCKSCGYLDVSDFYDASKLVKRLDEKRIKLYSEKWKALKIENSPLRMMISGNLTSLPEDFIDAFIKKELNKMLKEFRISELVGSVMGNYEFMLGDMIIYAGVMRLMDEGLIEVVDQWKKNPMNTLVRKI